MFSYWTGLQAAGSAEEGEGQEMVVRTAATALHPPLEVINEESPASIVTAHISTSCGETQPHI